MKLRIDKAIAIKPMIVRFSVEVYEGDNITGEFTPTLDIEPYVTYDINNQKPTINIDASAIQQQITDAIAEMQITGLIAQGFTGLDWSADEEKKDETSEGN